MNKVKRLFQKYLYSSMLLLLTFLIINALLLLAIMLITRRMSSEPLVPIAQIADNIKIDNQWNILIDDEVSKILEDLNAWTMIIDDKGDVIWEDSMPEQLPRHYTGADIAMFSRWYIDQYPVLVHKLSQGLLVVGCPPGSITKLNYMMDPNEISPAIYGSAFIIIVNVLLILFLFWHNTHKIEKAIEPILNGIILIAKGNPIKLSESSELAEINIELNRASERIIKKDNARADWINGISHDVRTPLSIILGYAGEIEDNDSLLSIACEKAGIIRKQGEKLRQLIADLNLTSRLEYSMQPLKLETVYPVELTRQVISEFLNNGLDNGFTIDFDAASDLDTVTIQGDCSLLSRMLANLIQNCISHNPNGCHITISVSKSQKGYKYTVADDGIGLTETQLEHFITGEFSELNYKANGETAHGFGLRLVQQIVKAHGGIITFKNILSGGLSISVLFPI